LVNKTGQRYLQILKILDLVEFQGASKTGGIFFNNKNEFKTEIINVPDSDG
jgi:hypothetical protein